MLQLIKFTSILIVWSLVILYLNNKETFESTTTNVPTESDESGESGDITFKAWGKTELGCNNRCILFKIQNGTTKIYNIKDIKDNCKNTCKNCSDTQCEWKHSSIKLNNKKNINNFNVQLISGSNNIILKWKYYNNNDLKKIINPIFNSEDGFYLIKKNTNIPIMFDFYNKEKEKEINYDRYKGEDDSILYTINKNEDSKLNPLEKNYWYLKTEPKSTQTSPSPSEVNSYKICNNEIHPLNSKWINIDLFDKFKKVENIGYDIELTNFIIQLVDAKNPDNGIQVYKYIEDSEKNGKLLNPEKNLNKIYKKEIKNLKTNTDYKLSIYPLFNKIDKTNNNTEIITGKDDKINDTTENILFSTKDFIVINK
jgi:hypothetical protein